MSMLTDLLASLFGMALLNGEKTFWLPEQASTAAKNVDWIFMFIYWLSTFFFVLIVGLTILFVIRYRARPGHKEQPSPSHSTLLEVTWSVIPSILLFFIFYYGYKGFMDLVVPPSNSYEIGVTAQRWSWNFTYPDGYVSENLHVPVDRPIRLVMTSEDVIHSFFVPAFRVKRDIVPGRYNVTWFEATKPGSYQIFCAEYCGTGHSDMLAQVIVHDTGEFDRWLEESSGFLDKLAPAEAGELLYKQRGCKQCHTLDGTIKIGPSFKDSYGIDHVLTDGSTVLAEENYYRQSMLDPQSQIVAGFDPVMPTYKGRLKDKEVTAIIAFIKSLSPYGAVEAETETPTESEAQPETDSATDDLD